MGLASSLRELDERLTEQPPYDPNMLTQPRDPSKLKQYFAAGFEVLCALRSFTKVWNQWLATLKARHWATSRQKAQANSIHLLLCRLFVVEIVFTFSEEMV